MPPLGSICFIRRKAKSLDSAVSTARSGQSHEGLNPVFHIPTSPVLGAHPSLSLQSLSTHLYAVPAVLPGLDSPEQAWLLSILHSLSLLQGGCDFLCTDRTQLSRLLPRWRGNTRGGGGRRGAARGGGWGEWAGLLSSGKNKVSYDCTLEADTK